MKRGTSNSTPSASKAARIGSTPATACRPHGRILLNVGGQQFQSSKSTLEGSSSYFRSLLARWDDETEDELFIDCDPDAFGVLLSHMRIASNLILPKHDYDLCARVILCAEYLGMEQLLRQVKAKAYANLHPGDEAIEDPVSAFDAEVGSLQDAINAEVLPVRFFSAVPPPPTLPPERTVKTLIPAPPGYSATFTDDHFDRGRVLSCA